MTRVKICGVCRLEDAELAVGLGAWALGLILWPGSRRRCPHDEAARIATATRRQAEVCGVFVNAHLDTVVRAVDELGLTIVQLHGDEGPAYCAEVARRAPVKVIKAMPVRSRADLQALVPFHTDFHLLDSGAGGRRGGTGTAWDWSLAEAHRGDVPVVLSGGLTPENAAEAIEVVRPYAVDTASGTEASPGVKDHDKLEAFFAAVESAALPA
jgi:phosphoribosylanthranilate isomerase